MFRVLDLGFIGLRSWVSEFGTLCLIQKTQAKRHSLQQRNRAFIMERKGLNAGSHRVWGI